MADLPTTTITTTDIQVHYAPLGVTLACVSWNYSFHNLISPILASLFAGNTCVVKCSEQVAWSSRHYIAAIQRCLKAHGHTGEEVQLVVCLPDVAGSVTRHPLIKHVTCTCIRPVRTLGSGAWGIRSGVNDTRLSYQDRS